jgi:hypothetical protein
MLHAWQILITPLIASLRKKMKLNNLMAMLLAINGNHLKHAPPQNAAQKNAAAKNVRVT